MGMERKDRLGAPLVGAQGRLRTRSDTCESSLNQKGFLSEGFGNGQKSRRLSKHLSRNVTIRNGF